MGRMRTAEPAALTARFGGINELQEIADDPGSKSPDVAPPKIVMVDSDVAVQSTKRFGSHNAGIAKKTPGNFQDFLNFFRAWVQLQWRKDPAHKRSDDQVGSRQIFVKLPQNAYLGIRQSDFLPCFSQSGPDQGFLLRVPHPARK